MSSALCTQCHVPPQPVSIGTRHGQAAEEGEGRGTQRGGTDQHPHLHVQVVSVTRKLVKGSRSECVSTPKSSFFSGDTMKTPEETLYVSGV